MSGLHKSKQTSTALERLKEAPWLGRESVQSVFAILGGPAKVRAVGGAVRDALLGLSHVHSEVDFATVLTPDAVLTLASSAGLKAVPTGIDHGTVTLVFADDTHEVTTLRVDVETDGRHAKVEFGTDWRADALRRDFTLNALYCGPDGSLFDPVDGLGDCLDGRVRFIGTADQRIAEDRLRVYRFFRFSARFSHERFDAEGLDAVARAAGELDQLSAERVGQEMVKLLALPKVGKTLEAMAHCAIVPLSANGLGLLQAMERLSQDPSAEARMVIFLGEWGARRLQGLWRLSNRRLSEVEAIARCAELLSAGQFNEAAYRFSGETERAVPVAGALSRWSRDRCASTTELVRAIEAPPFPVGGNDLLALGFAPGPELGRTLKTLENEWIAAAFKPTRPQLLARAGQMASPGSD